MPLYNNILLYKKGDDNSPGGKAAASNAPSTSMKLLQDHLLSKRRAKSQTTPSQRTNKPTDSSLQKLSENSWNSQDEYDPMQPNSYEILKAEYLKAEEQRLEARKSGITFNPNILQVLDQLDDEDNLMDLRGTSIAPPPSLHAPTNNSVPTNLESSNSYNKTNNPQVEKVDGASAAAKIMSKMGYKAGQGLGKDEQGISKPLEVEKSGLNVGRIMQPQFAKPAEDNSTNQPTRVILLQNMVGPGEVDDDLEAETKEECKKYGDVVKCLIYEIPNKRVPNDEAVRIFVEFRRVESAVKAINDLNGRYFGGRVVRASSYNIDRFNRYELGP